MKRIISALVAAALAVGTLLTGGITVSAASEKTAVDVVKEMGYGWNLGNTMEACGDWIDGSSVTNYETAWGAPVTTKEAIQGLTEYGFGAVRIPVAWTNMMSTDGKYTINADYLERVAEIVDYVIDSGMYAVMNIHWDYGWWTDFGSKDSAKADAAMKKYKTIWTQLSKYFKKYSDKLVFESANEELGDFGLGVNGNYEMTNKINQTFVDIVRKSGGNNKTRFLLIAGYNTNIVKTADERFKMPTDTIENHLMISVHYYDPSTYCIADNKDNSWGYEATWGTDEQKQSMYNSLEKMKSFSENGYGVIIGEYGVARIKNAKTGEYKMKSGSGDFFDTMLSTSLNFGFCSFLWDAGNSWYDRTSGQFHEKEIGEIFKSYAGKTLQKISGVKSRYIRTFGTDSEIELGAKSSGGALSYKSSDEAVATVSDNGTVKIVGEGQVTIIIKAAATNKYLETERRISLVVKPSKGKIKSAYSDTAGKALVIVNRTSAGISGVEFEYSQDAKLQNPETLASALVGAYKDTYSRTFMNLEKGKKYYFRVRAYVEADGTKYYGAWSAVKSVTVKGNTAQ